MGVLRVTFPAEIEKPLPRSRSSTSDRIFYRGDYEVDISGSFPTAQYVYDIVEADGIALPTKRRAHPRGADGRPNRDRAYVWIDLSDFGMS